MKKKTLLIAAAIALALPAPVMANGNAERIAELESQIAELQTELESLKAAEAPVNDGANVTDMEPIDIVFVDGNTILDGEDGTHDNYMTIRKAILSFRFDELAEKISEYSEAHPEDETATACLDLLNKYCGISGLIGKTDSFSGDYSIYYKGHEEISEDCNIVPYIRDQSDCRLALGFMADDWLFAEDAILKRNSEGVNDGIWLKRDMDSYKNDVLDGGLVYECIDESLYDPDIEYMASLSPDEEMALRFENRNNETLDHKVSKEDILAMQNIGKFSRLLQSIVDLRH